MSSDIINNVEDLREKLGERYNRNVDDLDLKLLKEIAREKFAEEKVGIKSHVHTKGYDLNDLYFKTIRAALKHGRLYKIDSGSFEGSHRIEFDSASLEIENPISTPLAPNPKPGIPVSTDDKGIEDYFWNYLMDGSLGDSEHYKYSSWIVGMPENLSLTHKEIPRGSRFNQLEWCIKHFAEKGYGTNHCAITIGCAEGLQRYDWPYSKENADTDKGSSECLRQILLKIKDNKLNLSAIFRSWDLFAGLPENLGGMAHLMNYIAMGVNSQKKDNMPEVEVGSMYAYSDGLHIYEHNLDPSKALIGLVEEEK